MRVEIYSDVACPWCYVGKRRFERALAAFPPAGEVEVVFRPYQLDPGAPARAVPLNEALARKFGPRAAEMGGRVVETARGEGIEMDFERALSANTFDAHRLMRLAEQEYGPAVQRTLADALFRAYFAEGGDVSDAEVLARLAEEAGMEPARARAYLASDEGADAVRAEIEQAQQLGITAVPTFVFDGKYAVQGAQPTSIFLQALETVAQEHNAAAEAADADGGACVDGVCEV